MSAHDANTFVTYLQSGGFIDQATEEVTVDVITLNDNSQFFASFRTIFKWEVWRLLLVRCFFGFLNVLLTTVFFSWAAKSSGTMQSAQSLCTRTRTKTLGGASS